MSENQKIDTQILERYQIIKKLGSGAYGHVWKVKNKIGSSSESFALKKIFDAFQNATDSQRTFRQISLLKKLNHPNLIKLKQVLPSSSGKDIYLLFEYMSTDLYRAIYDGILENIHKKYIIYQVLLGLYHLHSAKVIHRDLKPSNILLNQQCQAKICDFGLVRFIGMQDKNDDIVLTEGVATRWYRAPQVLLGSKIYDEKADMWSIGCIIAEMLLKCPIFAGNSTLQQLEAIMTFTGKPNLDELNEIQSQMSDIIFKQCSQIRRKNYKQFFPNNQDQQCFDLIISLLCFSKSKRLSAFQALKHPYLKQFFCEEDLKKYENVINLETDDNIRLTSQDYQQLIDKYFIENKSQVWKSQIHFMKNCKQPQRFSDLKKREKSEQSFTKLIKEMKIRKNSGSKQLKQRKNIHKFEQIIRQKENSIKHSRVNSNSHHKDKENAKQNSNLNQKQINGVNNLSKFSSIKQPSKPMKTFAALKKATNHEIKLFSK